MIFYILMVWGLVIHEIITMKTFGLSILKLVELIVVSVMINGYLIYALYYDFRLFWAAMLATILLIFVRSLQKNRPKQSAMVMLIGSLFGILLWPSSIIITFSRMRNKSISKKIWNNAVEMNKRIGEPFDLEPLDEKDDE